MAKNAERDRLYRLLGELPPIGRPINAELISVYDRGSYILEKLMLDLNGIEAVPAYFTIPKSIHKPAPAILYNHAHGGEYHIGKEELVYGRSVLQSPPYAEFLAHHGCCALCIDSWAFGERRLGRTESEIFKEMLWKGQVMWGMMVYDSLRAVDYMISRSEVNPERIGTLGISMGSTMAWWVAALDERIKVCVDICCLTDYQALIDHHGLDLHGIYYYVPDLIRQFSTAAINALIAPRPHLSLAGSHDDLTPLDGLHRVDAELRDVYSKENAKDAWKLFIDDAGHGETPGMRREIDGFLKTWLQ
jgi:dienelactone hydrolase